MTPLAEIARQAWMDCPLDGDHWAATAKAVRSKVIEDAIEDIEKLAKKHTGAAYESLARGQDRAS